MIDPRTEPLLSLRAAAAHPALCRDGRKPHVNTLIRWVKRGARAGDGRRVVLETVRVPGGICTSDAAVDRFIAALNAGENPDRPGTMNASRLRAVASAERELAAAGII
jgi:hypothetical protein